jgi:hypothetical protein
LPPDCTLVELPDPKHELFLKLDVIHDLWLAAIGRAPIRAVLKREEPIVI